MARCIPVKVLSQSPVNVSYIKSSKKAEKKEKNRRVHHKEWGNNWKNNQKVDLSNSTTYLTNISLFKLLLLLKNKKAHPLQVVASALDDIDPVRLTTSLNPHHIFSGATITANPVKTNHQNSLCTYTLSADSSNQSRSHRGLLPTTFSLSHQPIIITPHQEAVSSYIWMTRMRRNPRTRAKMLPSSASGKLVFPRCVFVAYPPSVSKLLHDYS